jgi:gamma-glutamyl hydrolase
MVDLFKKLDRVNGVLFPGGGGAYMDVAKLVIDYAIRKNDEGEFYPLWGTCLGFERIAILTASDPDNVLKKV